MAIPLALAAALANAVAAILQRLGVESAPADSTMKLSLLTYALRRGVWLGGFALLLVSGGLQAVALRFGQLSVVQPALATEIVFLVAILGVAFRYPLHAREWVGSVLLVAGLAAFFVVADPKGGRDIPSATTWVVTTVIIACAIAVFVAAGFRGPRWWRAAAFGAAASVCLTYNSALIKALTTYVTEGWGHVFTHFQPYAIAVTGAFGFFLLQNALHAGPVAASRTVNVAGNPMIAVILGTTLFGDRFRTGGVAIPLEVLTFGIMVVGIIVLARSPLVAGGGSADDPGESLADARAARRAAHKLPEIEPF